MMSPSIISIEPLVGSKLLMIISAEAMGLTFLDFKFILMSNFKFLVTGSYKDIHCAFKGVILC